MPSPLARVLQDHGSSPKLGVGPGSLMQREDRAAAASGDGFSAGFNVYIKFHLSSGSIPVGFAMSADMHQRQMAPGDVGSGRLLNVLSLKWYEFVLKSG